MDQIRDIYNKSKKFAKDKPQKITKQICNRMINLINKQSTTMEDNNDYSNIQQLLVYREKFQSIVQLYNQTPNKQSLHQRIRSIFQDNLMVQIKQKQQELSYFDVKKSQIQKSKVGVKQILGIITKISKKFEKKTQNQQIHKQQLQNIPNNQIRELKEEVNLLRYQLNNKNQLDYKIDLRNQQNRNLEKQIENLQRKIQYIKNQNHSLKSQIKYKSQRAIIKHQQSSNQQKQKDQKDQIYQKDYSMNYHPQQIEKYFISKPQKYQKQHIYYPLQKFKQKQLHYLPVQKKAKQTNHVSEYNPKTITTKKRNEEIYLSNKYQINYLPNDIGHLKEKTINKFPLSQYQPFRSNQIFAKQAIIKYQQSPILQIKDEPISNKNKLMQQKHRNLYQKQQKDNKESSNKPQSSFLFKKSDHKFNKSQIYDEAKNIAIRSKISFFKPSMIIYRGKQFEVAVKTIDVQRLLKKRISIYINNKQQITKQVKLAYKFNSDYYQVKSIKKVSSLSPRCQQKQELQVILLNSEDFDSIIEVQLVVNTKSIHFLIPTMFIDFLQKRPHNKKKKYQKEKVNPIHQFSNMHLTGEIIPIQIVHGQIYETGRVYAISRFYQGYIYFRWIEGKIQIQTIPQWKLFIAYLLLKDF